MAENINEWINQRLGARENPTELKERLSAYGYNPIIVDQITSPTPPISPENKENVKKFKINKFVIVGVIILIIIGIFSLNFINSISDLNKNRNLESNQALFMKQLDNQEKGLDELTKFTKDSVAICKEQERSLTLPNSK
ncbi:MAG: hypothetical protein DRN71_05685 [Candidatus Nanohalarchaeota archaeon]|nr:MAG: hypothetical protein DRN71_05685 [Candidatus Nanohaloarchaeota archaeon]